MKIQFINDAKGKAEYVVMPIAEYHRLANRDSPVIQNFTVEEKEENQWEEIAYDSDETDDVYIPHEVVSIMLDKSVSLIAAWRIYRGFTQAQVQQLTDISQASLSQIEKQGNKPQTKTIEKLAEAYNCEPEQLLD